MHFLRFSFIIFLFFTIFSCSSEKQIADTVLLNGTFFTADSSTMNSTALAIKDGLIIAIGSDEDIRQYIAEDTKKIDLKGAFTTPGLIEGHGHFESLGRSLINVNLLGTESWQIALDEVREKIKTAKPGEWIEGRGWHQEKWQNLPSEVVQGYPMHQNLSKLSPNNPVVLTHASGHALIANAKAMELSGISAETADPIGGRILRDAQGRPTGVFEENAMIPIEKTLDAYKKSRSEAEQDAAFRKAINLAGKHCIDQGITSFTDAGSTFDELERYAKMAEEGVLPVRLWAMILQPANSEMARLSDFPWIGKGKDMLTVRAVKAYFDGALGSYGAWLLEPYSDNAGFVGQNTTPIDTVALIAAACKQRGLQCCVHAIGDRGNREILNLFEKHLDGDTQARWRMEHAQHIDTADIPRFAKMGVIASMQAVHCTSDAPFVAKRLGVERAKNGAYAWRSLLDSGASLANGSDAPVERVDPLAGIHAACTRKRMDTGMEFFPEQCMTREEALLSYTLWNAYAAFQENEKGSLSIGKKADITVFSKNLKTCPAEEIMEAKVLFTLLNGKIVYEKLPESVK